MLDSALLYLSLPDTLTMDDVPDRPAPKLYVVSDLFFDSTPSLYRTVARSQARKRVVLTGIAVQRFRNARGTFPEQLSDLLPEFLAEVPTDPMDGQRLRYRVEGGGAIIYSIGKDRVDDGGRARIKHTNPAGGTYQDEPDITFTFGGLQQKLWPNEEDTNE